MIRATWGAGFTSFQIREFLAEFQRRAVTSKARKFKM